MTVVAAYAAIQLVFALGGMLPPLSRDGQYLGGIYLALGAVVVLAGVALVILQRRRTRTVVDVWLMVPAAALLIESLLNALGGSRYSVGWYLSRVDILVATTFLVVALLAETNRLSHVLANNERRLRGIVNGVTDALIAIDARGAVASVNPAAASMFGFVADDLTGTPVSRILPDYAGIADAPQATVVETTGRSARGGLFPVEFARGRDVTHASGETIIILRDITQRKVAEEAIRAAHDRAIEAAEVKSQFLATMSHEIRTPINAVVGMSELLLQTQLSDEAREYATTVRDSAESLLAIVNDILDFSKIEAGRMQLDSAPFSPVVAVENATDILAAAARKKGLSLTTYVAPDVPPRVAGDADRLRQVLLNLIGNAVKFTAEGSVTVRAVVDGAEGDAVELRFSVSDTGPGIAQDAAEQLFEPFRQADQSTRRRFGGTGLGLSISRRLVELMGGKIGFDSSPGRGSTFWFTVPYARVLEGAERERADVLRGARVLVVDDEANARQVVDQYLLAWGAAASSTGNAAHALELASAAVERHAPFDVVVADRRASGDAHGFAARLHALAGCENVPIVLLAGGEEPANAQDARAHGFVAVVRKPIRQNALHDTLLAALGDPSAPPVAARERCARRSQRRPRAGARRRGQPRQSPARAAAAEEAGFPRGCGDGRPRSDRRRRARPLRSGADGLPNAGGRRLRGDARDPPRRSGARRPRADHRDDGEHARRRPPSVPRGGDGRLSRQARAARRAARGRRAVRKRGRRCRIKPCSTCGASKKRSRTTPAGSRTCSRWRWKPAASTAPHWKPGSPRATRAWWRAPRTASRAARAPSARRRVRARDGSRRARAHGRSHRRARAHRRDQRRVRGGRRRDAGLPRRPEVGTARACVSGPAGP